MSSIKQHIIIRFGIVYLLMVLAFVAVIVKVVRIQYFEKREWLAADSTNVRYSIDVPASRGNIYSSEGKLMASTIPYYRLYMDFSIDSFLVTERIDGKKVRRMVHYDDLLKENVDSLSYCLAALLKDKTKEQYKNDILKAYNKKTRSKNGKLRRTTRYLLHNGTVSYVDLQQINKFPLIREGRFKSGFYTEDRLVRVHPFGSLAFRTIGDIYGENGRGRAGLELRYNNILMGQDGVANRQKVAGDRILINQVEPVDGTDIVTTIDVHMQDIAEKALRDRLEYYGAEEGCAVLMEVETGEIKAIANLVFDGHYNTYLEKSNVAFGTQREPGSTFKIASMIAALEDGVVRPTDSIDTGNGVYNFGNTPLRDHNYLSGGYGKISVTDVIKYSSNIGMARIVNEHYRKNPENFVKRLYDMKLNVALDMEIPGSSKPFVPHPKDSSAWDRTDPTALPWLSIGYRTEMPPIYTLMFFNAIANNGKMIKPFLVKYFKKDGVILDEFETETVTPAICSSYALEQIKPMLEAVVEEGTGQAVKSKAFKIAGKTGTVQIDYSKKSREKLKHQVSFCGYFPADNPKYTGIVVIYNPKRGPVSAGIMAGGVFKEMAEKVYARNAQLPILVNNEDTYKIPFSKNGRRNDLKTSFEALNITMNDRTSDVNTWVSTATSKNDVTLNPLNITPVCVPNVLGMGAADAVFLIESVGMRAELKGVGSVREQSVVPYGAVVKGGKVVLTLK